MNILFISKDLLAGNVAYLLTKEGHNVKLFIQDKDRRGNFEGLVTKIENWKNELNWVGKDGLIVFDETGFGKEQDQLRKDGYIVVGGSELGDKLEDDRAFGQSIFAESDMTIAPLYDFKNISEAIQYIKEYPDAWVIKQNGPEKAFNYVGKFEDGSDTISVLESYNKPGGYPYDKITLQKRVLGIEIGVARYFNGKDWVGPIEVSMEHKNLFPHNIGPTTGEMGTLAWYDPDDGNKLFQQTLAKMKSFLIEADFRGDISVNCIVNEDGAFPLEATARFGCPIVHLQSELHLSPWGDFLHAVARGENYDLKWKSGYGIVVFIVSPPFPYYHQSDHPFSSRGNRVYFDDLTEADLKHVHFEEISLKKHGNDNHFYISDNRGYTMYVSNVGSTIDIAREKAYSIIERIHFPKMYYRNDIGLSFNENNKSILESLGYL